jgi:hypothetical protein
MAVVCNIGAFPQDIWKTLFYHCDLKMLGTIASVCKQFQEMTNDKDLWKFQALKMLSEIPTPPVEGWKAWVKQPSPVKFALGFIDLTKGEIEAFPGGEPGNTTLSRYTAVDVASLLGKIPGKLTCSFTMPMGHQRVWYRKEAQPLIEFSDCFWGNPTPQEYDTQYKESDNRKFYVILKYTKTG